MMIKTLSAFILLSLSTAAFSQTPSSFEDLQRITPEQIGEIAMPSNAFPSEKSWGVTYSLKGMLSVNEGGIFINTVDGRLFKLDLSKRKSRKFNGKPVIITADARQSDELEVLKVTSISEYAPKAGEVEPAAYQPRRRQALVISDKDGELTMGNVRTLKSEIPSADAFDWTTMTLKPELIKNVYFVKKPFTPEFVAAHSFFVFTFEDGGLTDAEGNKPMGLALSIEGRTRVDQSFSPVTGLMNKFGIIWSLSTWEEYAARTIHLEKGHLVPYPVNLSRSEKSLLLREAMAMAAVDREGEFYHTIKNNCTNNMLILMNRILPKERQIKMWTIPYMVYNVKATMPLMVIKNLQKRGLLGEEFTDINSSTLQSILP